ncbi:hypothetical protein Tco_0093211 [Tanacetum coccineum]
MAQQVIPAAQLIPRNHTIGRCNNYVMLQSIQCSPECKIIGKILLDHPLSYALSAIADVPVDTKEYTYIVDMFQVTLHLLVETPKNPFVTPVNIQTIKAFMNRVGYQGVVDKWDFLNNLFQKKEAIQYPRFIKLIIANLMKKFLDIPQRVDEDYHSTKDDTPLENIAKVQEILDKEEIEKMVEGDKDEESYASEFVDSMINDNVDDSGTKVEPGSHKEHPEIEKSNVDDAMGSMEFRKEKMQTPIPSPIRSPRKVSSSDKRVSEELTGNVSPTPATTSKDSSKSKRRKQPISYRMKILPGSIAGMCRRRGQIRSYIKNKFITHDFFMGKIQEVLDHCNKVVPELTFAKTNEMINKEMPRLVNLAINKDREVDPINAQEMIA